MKLLRTPADSAKVLDHSLQEFDRVMDARRPTSLAYHLSSASWVSTVLMLVVVVDFPIADFEQEQQRLNEHFLKRPEGIAFELRVYSFKELKERFGLS